MPAGYRRTAGHREAAGPLAADFGGSTPGYRRGCSLLSSIGLIPAVEGLFGRVRHFAVPAPGIEAVVDDPPREMRESHIGGGDRGAVRRRPRQQLTGRLHFHPLGQRGLMPLDKYPPPRIDLLVDIDFHRADIAATPVQCRSEGQVAVFSLVEGRIDDQADRAGVSGAVAEATAAAVDRTGVHTGATADAFKRGPELLHAEALRAAIFNRPNMHPPPSPRPVETGGVWPTGQS